jgi:hypothetical protein
MDEILADEQLERPIQGHADLLFQTKQLTRPSSKPNFTSAAYPPTQFVQAERELSTST